MGNNIHWFPGHMNKALNEIKEKAKLVDVVIEIFDARIPLSSFNKEFENSIANKQKLFIFNKTDLADPIITKDWEKKFISEKKNVIFTDIAHNDVSKLVCKKIEELAVFKHEKDKARGMKPLPVKAMIIGIPNVGKSSLINKIAKHKVAGVENRPGFTRGEQMIKINNDFLLLDTPGVLPMNYEDKNKAINLALTGAVKEDILPTIDLAEYLLKYINKFYPSALQERFGIDDISSIEETLKQIAIKRGFLLKQNMYDIEKAAYILLKEFKDGKLGRISLERVN